MSTKQMQLRLEMDHSAFALDQIIESCMQNVASLFQEKRVELTYVLGDDVPNQLNLNRQLLESTILRLLRSAIKHTQQGEVLILIHVEAQQDKESTDKTIKIMIADTGDGMSSTARNRIETMMQQCSPLNRYRGHFAKCIEEVRFLGGRMGIKSERFKGTTTSIELPASCVLEKIERRQQTILFEQTVILYSHAAGNSALMRYVKPISRNVILARDQQHLQQIAEQNQIELLIIEASFEGIKQINPGYVVHIKHSTKNQLSHSSDSIGYLGHCVSKPLLSSSFDRSYFEDWQQRKAQLFTKVS